MNKMPQVIVKTQFGEKKANLDLRIEDDVVKLSLKVEGRVLPINGTMTPEDFAEIVYFLRHACHELAIKSLINKDYCVACHRVFHTDGAARSCDLMAMRLDFLEKEKAQSFEKEKERLKRVYGVF